MTIAYSAITVAAALSAAEEMIGASHWTGSSDDHSYLLSLLPEYQAALSKYYAKQVNGYSAPTASALNEILAKNGFDIRLSEWPPAPGAFGVVGLSDIAVSWKKAGELSAIYGMRRNYPAFSLDAEPNGRLVQVEGLGDELVVELSTTDGQIVRVAMVAEPANWRTLTDAARLLWRAPVVSKEYIDKIIMPMVKLDIQPDINWMVGIGQDTWSIGQAVQQSKFGMNQFGARAKEATGFGLESMSPTHFVDRPFLIVIGQPGASVPGFQAFVTEEHWVDPGDLSKL